MFYFVSSLCLKMQVYVSNTKIEYLIIYKHKNIVKSLRAKTYLVIALRPLDVYNPGEVQFRCCTQ